MSFVVAIDGPAGTGKGTITKLIEEELGFMNVDTGAMYRCVTLDALRKNIDFQEIEKMKELVNNIHIELKKDKNNNLQVILNGDDVSKEIREPVISANVSNYSTLACVREAMLSLQRNMKTQGNIVMEGRDIGTVVFPDADIKIYLDASIEECARRRYKQNLEKGINQTYEEVLEAMKRRNWIDSTRELSPFRKAEDAIYIDTTNMKIEEEKEYILKLIKDKMNSKGE